MTNQIMGYTNRANVENFLGRVFSDVTDAQFAVFELATEVYINNYLGYNAETTTSGILAESIQNERTLGKIDNYGNLVIDLMKPPVLFDPNDNPRVTLVQYEFGGIRVPLQITDGTNNPQNTLLDVSENRRKIIYPSIYFLPYLPTVTPTAKMNLFNLRDTKFWVVCNYIGGYPTVPGDIVMAANLICGNMLTVRDNPNFAASLRQGSYQIEYFLRGGGGGIPGKTDNRALQAAQELLDPYVRYTW